VTAWPQNLPFPQHVAYTAGTIKPALPQTALDSATKSFYDAWKVKYLVNGCVSNHYYIFYQRGLHASPANAITVSEAHGYAC